MRKIVNKMTNNKDRANKEIIKAENKIALYNQITEDVGKLLKSLNFSNDVDLEETETEQERVILDVRNVQKYYSTSKKVLDEITFKVFSGEFFGIVGESGSGKSTLGKIIIRIINNSGGTILFDDRFISSKKLLKTTRKWLSQNIQMVFQSPISSLNPKKKVLDLIKEPLTRSDFISKKVDILIDIHKILNYVFKYRTKILIENFNIDFYKKYYSILLNAYFTFQLKYFIYEYYINSTNKKVNRDQFLNNISALYNRYKDPEKDLDEGFLGPIYDIQKNEQLNIYNPINLSSEQKEYLWKRLINDSVLLDALDINLTSNITDINSFFDDLAEADDFIISAVDELDGNIKLVLNIAAKHFSNITDITRMILRKISRKDLYQTEKEVIEAYNNLQKAEDAYKNNPLNKKINKIIKKKERNLKEFQVNYKNKTGINALNILRTYLSTSKEEIKSVDRSLVNVSNDPIMFLYYSIKKATLKERYNVVKTLGSFNDLTAGQIDFLIEKVWVAIQEKYANLFSSIQQIRDDNEKNLAKKSDIAERIVQLRQQLKNTWNQYGKELPQYKKAIAKAKEWSKENKNIYQSNIDNVNTQKQQLLKINDTLQASLNQRVDNDELKQKYETSKITYDQAMKKYLIENEKMNVTSRQKVSSLKAETANIISTFDPILIKFMKQTTKFIQKLPKKINENSKIYALDREGIVKDLERVNEGIGSSFLEVKEIISNANTYVKLYNESNPKNIRKKLIKHLTKLYVFDTLESVGLKQEHAFRYIYEFSGGQRQRIAIARSLVSHPKLIIADEPISALDVSIQAQVVNIMKNLAKERNITFLFIAHDLSMVHYACERMIIINKGHILEKGNTNAIFENPGHPYTRTLLKAVPELSNIHLNLAKESEKVDQPYGDYNPIDNPKFYSVSDELEHYVYGTLDQVQQWNPQIKDEIK